MKWIEEREFTDAIYSPLTEIFSDFNTAPSSKVKKSILSAKLNLPFELIPINENIPIGLKDNYAVKPVKKVTENSDFVIPLSFATASTIAAQCGRFLFNRELFYSWGLPVATVISVTAERFSLIRTSEDPRYTNFLIENDMCW